MMNECSELLEKSNHTLRTVETKNEAALCSELTDQICNDDNATDSTNQISVNHLDGKESHSDETDVVNNEQDRSTPDGLDNCSDKVYDDYIVEDNEVGVKYINSLKDDQSADINDHERVTELEGIVLQQQKKITDYESQHQILEHRYQQISHVCLDLENKLQTTIKQCDVATKEKESMVMRYAVSEKGVMDQRAGRDQAERKLQETLKEKEFLHHKLTGMVSEKARICQLLDNKCYEFKGIQQELDRSKSDLSALETKLKWSQNSLKTELELHKESVAKVELLTNKLQEAKNEVEKIKRDTQESIKSFYQSQDNRAHVLDQQLKEQHAILILEKHEREEREHQNANIKSELDRLQHKHQVLIEENNSLSLKVQQLERARLENEQKLSELRGCADQHRQDDASITALTSSVEQLKLQLQHEQEQREVCSQQVTMLKQRNIELETDMDACRVREADMLLFTQQLTDKNVRLQSEFSALETKVQQLTCEQTLLKRKSKEHETRANMVTKQLEQEQTMRQDESQMLARHLAEKTKLSEQVAQQLEDQKGENSVIKRKLELSIKEVSKELFQCRKRLEQFEKVETSTNSRSSSSSSLNVTEVPSSSSSPVNLVNSITEVADHQVIQPDNVLDRQILIDHIIKLQRASAKKSEKLDFLEEHVQTLVMELQRKSRLLQSYMLREQAGALSSNKMDDNKAELARSHGVMASVYGSKVTDTSVTLELSLDINRKLQAILEDTLLKNITLKENVDTLGDEIERLNKLIKT